MMSANQGASAENMEMELRAYCEPPPITIFKHLIALSGQIQVCCRSTLFIENEKNEPKPSSRKRHVLVLMTICLQI